MRRVPFPCVWLVVLAVLWGDSIGLADDVRLFVSAMIAVATAVVSGGTCGAPRKYRGEFLRPTEGEPWHNTVMVEECRRTPATPFPLAMNRHSARIRLEFP